MTILNSELQRDATFERRRTHWLAELDKLAGEERVLERGGGDKALARLRDQGKMTARERVVGALRSRRAASRARPLGGLWSLPGVRRRARGRRGRRHRQRFTAATSMVVANDADGQGGRLSSRSGCKKVLRAQEIALENRLPIVYLVDSAGVFLPLQDEIFPDREHYGRIFYNNARLSAAGVFQMSAILGSCVAGGAYLPIMSDESHIVEGTGSIFLAGAHLVQAAIGEKIDNESLGGAVVQIDISGVVDHRHPDDATCLARIRMPVRAARRRRAGAVRAARAAGAPPPASRSCSASCRSSVRAPTTRTSYSRACSTTRSSTSSRRTMARPWSAAPAGSPGAPSASSPTSARSWSTRPDSAPRTRSSRSAA